LRTISTTELLKLPRSTIVLEALLTRADAVDADRMVALGELAKARKTDTVSTLLARDGKRQWVLATGSDRSAKAQRRDGARCQARPGRGRIP